MPDIRVTGIKPQQSQNDDIMNITTELRLTCTLDLLLQDYVVNVNTPDWDMPTATTHLNYAQVNRRCK